ncbi:hypothetical protein L6164_023571 [Bauhinia variegata]|uniref:Uncharacterized protein n=1 Tax=Bauhinia variegata TaxID=167791 RepID=A0ACB9MKJ6_BAUVA|nr:hypothetical protein L6164_023571 [Bauhinia variegata]
MDFNHHDYSSWLQPLSPSMASAIDTIGRFSVITTRTMAMLLMTVVIVNFLGPNSLRRTIIFAIFITGCCCGVLAILSQCFKAIWGVQFQLERRRIAMPPQKIFKSETTGFKDQCVFCLEEFKNGELVQPFPICNHEFHASCINTWLNGGKTTCPICRFSLQEIVIVERTIL